MDTKGPQHLCIVDKSDRATCCFQARSNCANLKAMLGVHIILGEIMVFIGNVCGLLWFHKDFAAAGCLLTDPSNSGYMDQQII